MNIEQFVKTNLGDVVILENGIPISKKIRNYYKVWYLAPLLSLDKILEQVDDTYESVLEDGSVETFTIDRSKHYKLIYDYRRENWGMEQ